MGFLVAILWVLWVEVVVNFMGFDPNGKGGFFYVVVVGFLWQRWW